MQTTELTGQDVSIQDCGNNTLSVHEIQNIYLKLSVCEDISFDVKDENAFLQSCIEKCFDDSFLKMLTTDIENNSVLLNNAFVKLIKYCVSEHNFKKGGLIFIAFCDYFDLCYNKTYTQLHEKLQNLIKNTAKCMCGSEYTKNSKKVNCGIVTLFDLVNKRATTSPQ